ncbi:MAG: SMP-30/gluconolactonase/LRE family protein [Dehalococcoidales bacterium]|nr:SMP-30/gluconolactonase/LRE family protein [Dehalococcoidales bacterium]
MDKQDSLSGAFSPVPLPHELVSLPVIEAEPWFKIAEGTGALIEGPAFNKEGDFFTTDTFSGTVFKISPRKEMSVIFEKKGVIVDGTALHKDGRLFIVCLSGELLSMNPDGSEATFMYPKYNGKTLYMNDLVFDADGNIYVTDFTGSIADPTGGVYRLSPDAKTVHSVLQHLASPNGISLSPDGTALWVAESARNDILYIGLQEDRITPRPILGVGCVYYSTGWPGPDSNKVDKEGNLYQCIMGQGRILVLNAHGIPVANVVIPGRAEGKYLRTSNLAFKPGTREGYITTSGEGGAWIYRFTGLSEGLPLFSHQ